MKHQWFKQDGGEELVLFFSGWGTDACHAGRLFRDSLDDGFGGDMLAFYDYTALTPDIDLQPELSLYRRITLIAWSFGVWAARAVPLPPIAAAVALNGTLFPVDRHRGIDPEIFQATHDGYGEDGRRRFERRMCGGTEVLSRFSECPSTRTTEDQKNELSSLQCLFSGPVLQPGWEYDHAFIGGRDAIFPAARQDAAWDATPRTLIAAMPHYPFFHCRTIREVTAWQA
ncbi:pimeloyl-ACP methyl esterase BioG family protein [Pelodictyon luteolum]|uniref:DUF452 family protein n=1 Tax=Chlorobium luteolum (strain DSM 273 / BCRC 81028 / 2530) TaxID=319225 RepID=Q3B171_CHLL3|nr:pimeloyl-ACP methyl esterase BioG family protein [Pelodictyon luteolum]ABB24910.1 conserved hypothetical protein [Pelodictyon luteolum DSM 273]